MKSLSREEFLKQMFFILLCAGFSPSWAISQKKNDEAFDSMIDEAVNNYYSFKRQINNHQKLAGLSYEEKERQYNGLLNILEKAKDPSFTKLSVDEQISVFNESKPFDTAGRPAKDRILNIGPTLYLTGGLVLAGTLILRGKTLGLATLLGATIKAPPILQRAATIMDAGIMSYSGYQIGKDLITDSIIASAETLNNVLDPHLYEMGEFNFENSIPGLNIQIGNYELSSSQSNDGPLNQGTTGDLLKLLTNGQAMKPDLFNNQKVFEEFLEQYIPILGQIQEENLRKVLEAKAIEDQSRIIEARERAAFIENIQQFIGVAIIGKIAAAKEAQVLNTLLSAGFDFALSTVTPIGWASVGIKLATVLSGSNGNNKFNKAVMAALQNIMNQLDVLLKNVEVIQQNQVIILKQLNVILENIKKIEDLLGSKFKEISRQNSLIYDLIEVKEIQKLQSEISESNRRLDLAIINKKSDEIYDYIQRLTGNALNDLQTVIITKFSPSFHSSSDLKTLVVSRQKYRYNISLYDSIGLCSALRNYSHQAHGGICEGEPIVHPQMFLDLTDRIVNWIIVSDLNLYNRQRIAQDLLAKAIQSNEQLKQYCDKETVVRLLDQHLYYGGEIIKNVRESLISYLKSTFNSDFFSWDDAISTKVKQFDYKTPYFDEKLSDPKYFFSDKYDNVYITAALEYGVITSIKRIKTMDRGQRSNIEDIWEVDLRKFPDRVFKEFNKGRACCIKNNRLVFQNTLLSYTEQKYGSFELDYECRLVITEVDLIPRRDLYASFDYVKAYKQVRKTKGQFFFGFKWKEEVREVFKKAKLDLKTCIPNFDKYEYNLQNFLSYLIDQQQWNNRIKLVERAKSFILKDAESDFDGYGIASMYLSKLNESISSGDNRNFMLEYGNASFIREDYCLLLDNLLALDLPSMKPDDRIEFFLNYEDFNNYKELYDKDESYEGEVECWESYCDLMMAVLNKGRKTTYDNVKNKLKDIESKYSEPLLLRAIAKLDGYLNLIQ